MRTLVVRALRAAGHTSLEAATCDEGLASAILHLPDAIVLDGRLSNDAAGLVSALLVASPSSAVFVLASLEERAVVRSALRAGARGALLRPLRSDAFLQALAEVEGGDPASRGAPPAQDASAPHDAK